MANASDITLILWGRVPNDQKVIERFIKAAETRAAMFERESGARCTCASANWNSKLKGVWRARALSLKKKAERLKKAEH